MMLKQSSSRNLRAKSLKVKHGLKIFVILAICIWFLYQVYKKKEAMEEERPSTKVSENGENVYQILRTGRKDLKPQLEEVGAEFDEEVEVEDVQSNMREREKEGEEIFEEIDAGDQEKSDGAKHDQFINEDGKDD